MEMKQKEQEINKRKKRLLWKEKRMKETVLNAVSYTHLTLPTNSLV